MVAVTNEHVVGREHDDALQRRIHRDGQLATNPVADAAPGDPPEPVENRVPGHGRAGQRPCPNHAVVLQHVDTEELDAVDHHEPRDARKHENQPQHVELWCAQHVACPELHGPFMIAGIRRWRGPAGGLVAVRWIDHDRAAKQHQHGQRYAVNNKHALYAREAENVGRVEEPAEPGAGQLDPDGRAEAKTGDGKASDQALLVGEPLHAHRNRHNVSETDARTADDTNAQQLNPEALAEEAGQYVAGTQQQATGDGQPLRPCSGQYATRQHHHDRERREA